MKKARLSVAALLGAALAFALAFASCDNGGDAPIWIPSSSSTSPLVSVYSPSANLSDYMKRTMNNMNVKKTGADVTPDVFVLKVKEVQSYSSGQLMLAVKTLLEGKTLVLDNPSEQDVKAFGVQLNYALDLEENAELKSGIKVGGDISHHSLYKLISALSDDDTTTNPFTGDAPQWSSQYAAIGLRGDHIYHVHDVTGGSEIAVGNSAKSFAEWISKTNAAEVSRKIDAKGRDLLVSKNVSASSLDNLVSAQTFTHNFITSGYDKWISENVNVTIDVWPACNMDAQIDYYLVRTSVACHNEETVEKNPQMIQFSYVDIDATMDESKQTVRVGDCSPQTTQGSTSFTSGSSYTLTETQGTTFGGNIGFGITSLLTVQGNFGYTQSTSTVNTVSQSSTTSIPDISVEFQTGLYTKNGPHWAFKTPNPNFGGYLDVKEIQKRTAVFDTYAVYTLPSDVGQDDGKVELKTRVAPIFARWNGPTFSGLLWPFDDHIAKPCNKFRNYIMAFSAPAKYSTEDLKTLRDTVKTYIPYWGDSKGIGAVGENRLDSVAASCFDVTMKTIKTNKNVFKDNGFSGEFEFYIQNTENGNKIKTEKLTF